MKKSYKYDGDGCELEQAYPERPQASLKHFKETFDKYTSEIGISEDGSIGSHKIKGDVSIRCLNNEKSYRIVGLDVTQLMGCGCWDGVVVEIIEED